MHSIMTHPTDPQKMKIGLETHVTLNTRTKLFCACPTGKTEVPNAHTCPVCLGLPGSKPFLNKKAVERALTSAFALNFDIRKKSRFARKNYYYPDLSKNYQITQYDEPLAEKGSFAVGEKIVELTRIHIEEDPAQIIYPFGNISSSPYVWLDYNRSGMPLVEIVTEPCLTSPADAKAYLEELFRLLAYLGVIDATAERVMKTDANLSIPGGERVEIKNITSFAAVEKALQAEYFRQKKLMQENKPIERQTRLFSEETNTTLLMRTKEQEEDYGYIVEPDLPPLTLSEAFIEGVRLTIKELPQKAIARLQNVVPVQYAPVLVYQGLLPYFESSKTSDKTLLARWTCGNLLKAMNYGEIQQPSDALKVGELDRLLAAIAEGRITERAGMEYIKRMVAEKKTLNDVMDDENGNVLGGSGSNAVDPLIQKILTENAKAVAEYRAGKAKSLEFLVGQFLRKNLGLHTNEVRDKLRAELSKEN
ncbi:MAG TPA: Asp-tRNA(Asn)/Glu-tRNA(Gln) amidotransferase subunit GatB [Candidatus Norongarragalinales archaeon]|nr:Asp-tRNA(Asn)/Glu-tRNA(Gln) amidotransferase subunit GatB [Candidatus Norongarragalinales archaeon]